MRDCLVKYSLLNLMLMVAHQVGRQPTQCDSVREVAFVALAFSDPLDPTSPGFVSDANPIIPEQHMGGALPSAASRCRTMLGYKCPK